MESRQKPEKTGTPQQTKSTRYQEEIDEDDDDRESGPGLSIGGVRTAKTPKNQVGQLQVTATSPASLHAKDMGEDEEDDLGFGGIEDSYGHAGTPEDAEFDRYVSAIQDVLVSDEFNEAVENFHRAHCNKFVETEENTHEMWTLHKKFKTEIEALLDKLIKEQAPDYSQGRFEKLCADREGEIDEAVLDALLAFDNFQEFKRQGLETRLRQMKREEPERYKQVVQSQQSYELVQEIHSLLQMEEEGIAVCGKLGAEDMF